MSNKIEFLGIAITALSVSFADAVVVKVVLSIIGAVTFVTVSRLYSKWLDKRLKDKECKCINKEDETDEKL